MIDLVKLKEQWAEKFDEDANAFAAAHFDELIEEIELLRKQCEVMWDEITENYNLTKKVDMKWYENPHYNLRESILHQLKQDIKSEFTPLKGLPFLKRWLIRLFGHKSKIVLIKEDHRGSFRQSAILISYRNVEYFYRFGTLK